MAMLYMNSMSGYSASGLGGRVDSDFYFNADNEAVQVFVNGAGPDGPDLPYLTGLSGGDFLAFPLVSRPKTVFMGFWFWNERIDQNFRFISFGDPDAAIVQGGFLHKQAGGLVGVRGTGTEVGTPVRNVLGNGRWDFFELKYRCDNTTGEYIMRINGQEVLRTTGVDSQGGSTDVTGNVWFVSPNPDNYRVSQIWIWDDVGTLFSTFIGPRRLVQLYPSGSGGNQDWARSTTGSTNWELVLSDPVTSVEYVEVTSTGDTDQYEFDNLSTDVNQLECVQVTAALLQTDTNAGAMVEVFLESTGTEVTGKAVHPAGDTRTFLREIYETDPNLSTTWTVAALDKARVGIRAVASTT